MKGDFGTVMQHAYIVPDIEAAIPQWTALGVGPFFSGKSFAMDEYQYRGTVCACTLRVAIGYWGGMQVELIQPVGDTTTLYTDAVRDAPGLLNHFGSIVSDIDALIERENLRSQVIQRGTARGTKFAYVEGLLPGGVLLELIERSDLITRSSAFMAEAARNWDGTRPIRSNEEIAQAMAARAI